MKTRVLFVDDEPLVLQALSRMLRHMREGWDMVFVESGAAALARLEQEPFDVVVSDMRMPGMSGAELLNEVMIRHPRVVRLILSGHADRDLILRCVGATHQYLSKPCEPELLKSTILRAGTLGTHLDNEALKDLVLRVEHLPSLSDIFLRISRLLEDPYCTAQQVGELVARDMGLSAMALKLVNSAFFGLRRQVASPVDAVVYLGLETVKSLALVQGLFGEAQTEVLKRARVPPVQLMEHALQVAHGAKRIAQLQQAGTKVMDEAFVAGLLHDAGILVLASGFPDAYAETRRLAEAEGLETEVAEHRVFGAAHPQVGAYLLGLWGLPAPVVEAVAFHHQPARSGVLEFGALAALHAAEALVEPPFDGVPPDTNFLTLVGAGGRLEDWRARLAEVVP